MTRSRTTLAARITALCLGVAVVALVVSGLLWNRMVTASARDMAQESIAKLADYIASTVDEDDFKANGLRMGKLLNAVQAQGVDHAVLRPQGQLTPVGTPAVEGAEQIGLAQFRPGQRLSGTVTVDDQELLVEARGISDNTAIALFRPVEVAETTQAERVGNVLLASGVGLAVAAAAGLLLSRVLARPLRSTAAVARQMRDGRRDLRASVAGPAEVADVADSVNRLADALGHSESRQREFLLSVSHELRTPLTALKGFAESLADGVVEGEDVRRVGHTMSDEALRLERLVSDLLDLARVGADEFHLDATRVELGDLVRGCAEVWQPRSEAEGVLFQLELPPDPLTVDADPRRLRQAVDILADNALRVLPPGAPLVIGLHAKPGVAILQVRDGGPGLSEEDYRIAFERGALRSRYRGKRPVGSGVGLALAHGLVTRMGGTLQAGPAPEGGAAFTITLPR